MTSQLYSSIRHTCISKVKNVLGNDSTNPLIEDALEIGQLELDSLDQLDVIQQLENHYNIILDFQLCTTFDVDTVVNLIVSCLEDKRLSLQFA